MGARSLESVSLLVHGVNFYNMMQVIKIVVQFADLLDYDIASQNRSSFYS